MNKVGDAFGVEIFFVLSGFLITYLLLKEFDKTGDVSLKHFYIRRCLRIVPVYLVFAGVVMVIASLSALQLSGWDWLAFFTYTMFWGTVPE